MATCSCPKPMCSWEDWYGWRQPWDDPSSFQMLRPAVATPAEPREVSCLLLPPWESGVELDNWKTENIQQLSWQLLPRVISDTQPCQTVGQQDVQAATDVQDLTLATGQSGGESQEFNLASSRFGRPRSYRSETPWRRKSHDPRWLRPRCNLGKEWAVGRENSLLWF